MVWEAAVTLAAAVELTPFPVSAERELVSIGSISFFEVIVPVVATVSAV
jgi:hypothetical protein